MALPRKVGHSVDEWHELRDLQRRVVQLRAERGFTTDPLRLYTLLNEEIGEIAGQLKRTWSPNYAPFEKSDLAEEVADCMVLLLALAERFDIDVAQAIENKFFRKDSDRVWQTAQGQQAKRSAEDVGPY